MDYDPTTHPIDTVFTAVEKFLKFAAAGNQHYTQQQTLSIAYTILNNTGRFAQAFKEWNDKPAAQKIWNNMKTRFRNALRNLRTLNQVSFRDSQFNQANLIENIANAVTERFMMQQPPEEEAPPVVPPVHTSSQVAEQAANLANAAVNDNLLSTVVSNMHAMQSLMLQLQAQLNQNGGNNRQGRTNNARNRQRRQRTHDQYCRTHGLCAHAGRDCRNKATGH